MADLNKPHDALARKYLTDVGIAKEFLSIHLDKTILQVCDLNTLSIEPSSYIEDDLKSHYSDVVYKMNLKYNASGCVYIYQLVEHQSTPDEMMPFRIIKYQLAIIQDHINKYGKEYGLPLVPALVFYHGKESPYPHSQNILDLFADKDLYKKAQLGQFGLIDLTVMDTSEILKHGKVAVLEMFQKIAFIRDIKPFIHALIEVLKWPKLMDLAIR